MAWYPRTQLFTVLAKTQSSVNSLPPPHPSSSFFTASNGEKWLDIFQLKTAILPTCHMPGCSKEIPWSCLTVRCASRPPNTFWHQNISHTLISALIINTGICVQHGCKSEWNAFFSSEQRRNFSFFNWCEKGRNHQTDNLNVYKVLFYLTNSNHVCIVWEMIKISIFSLLFQ